MKRFFAGLIRMIFFWRKRVAAPGTLPNINLPSFRTTGGFQPMLDEPVAATDEPALVNNEAVSEHGLRVGDKFQTLREYVLHIENPGHTNDVYFDELFIRGEVTRASKVRIPEFSVLLVTDLINSERQAWVEFESLNGLKVQYMEFMRSLPRKTFHAPMGGLFIFPFAELKEMKIIYCVESEEKKEAERRRFHNRLEAEGHH